MAKEKANVIQEDAVIADNVSVKVMRSYDYCHFEVALGLNEQEITISAANELRKHAMRLVDEAVRQYKVARRVENMTLTKQDYEDLQRRVKIIKENYPMSEWTPEQQAIVKELDDWNWRYYDYEDDWEDKPIEGIFGEENF